MANVIKSATTTSNGTIKSNNFLIGVDTSVIYGPTSSTNFWNSITPSVGGYVVYEQKQSQGPSIRVAPTDDELITIAIQYGGTNINTVYDALTFFSSNSQYMVTNLNYPNIVTSGLTFISDAGFTASYRKTGTTWSDLSTYGNNATLTNGPTYSTLGGGSILFDGTDDYAVSPLAISAVTSNSIQNVTLQCWVYISSTSKKGAFIKVGFSGGYALGVGLNVFDSLGNEVIGLFPGNRWIDTNQTYGTGWKMVTMVLNSSSVPSFYLGTTSLGSFAGANPGAPDANIYIGRNVGDEPVGVRAFNGQIAIVQIYNRALSATEITQNYNALKGRFGL